MTDTLRYVSLPAETDDARRRGLSRVFRLGLVRYLARTPAASRITVRSKGRQDDAQTIPADDRWKNWVYRISLNSNFDGEESFKSRHLGGRLRATRVTTQWKTELYANESYNQSDVESELHLRIDLQQHRQSEDELVLRLRERAVRQFDSLTVSGSQPPTRQTAKPVNHFGPSSV